MEDNFVTKDNERVKSFFKTLDRMLDKIESSLTNSKPTLNGERFLTDKEVYQRLRISRSTLQDWRYSGQIPYIQIGGKILFRESDIQAMLDKNLKKAFR